MRTFKMAFVATIFSFCFLVVSSYGADVAKIGVVDFMRILEVSSAGKSARVEIDEQRKKMEADLEKQGSEIKELQAKLERESLVMSKEKRTEKERELRTKFNDFMLLEKKFKKERQILDRKLTINIQKEIIELAKMQIITPISIFLNIFFIIITFYFLYFILTRTPPFNITLTSSIGINSTTSP